MNKKLRWVFSNGAFLGAMISGLYYGVDWALYVSISIVWFVGFVCIGLYHEDVIREYKKQRQGGFPRWIDVIFDIAVVCLLMYHGWMISGVVYLFTIFATHYAENYILPEEDIDECI